MPDIIESFFNNFGYHATDFYNLVALNPQFEIIFQDGKITVPESYDDLKVLFEDIEREQVRSWIFL
jgi:phytoene desaturase